MVWSQGKHLYYMQRQIWTVSKYSILNVWQSSKSASGIYLPTDFDNRTKIARTKN